VTNRRFIAAFSHVNAFSIEFKLAEFKDAN